MGVAGFDPVASQEAVRRMDRFMPYDLSRACAPRCRGMGDRGRRRESIKEGQYVFRLLLDVIPDMGGHVPEGPEIHFKTAFDQVQMFSFVAYKKKRLSGLEHLFFKDG